MAVTENNVLMKYKNSAGNIVSLYPMTKEANVVGLDEVIRKQSVVTTGNGSTYLAAVEGIDALSAGVSFVMVPHVDSTATAPKLNVNSLGDKFIRRRVSSSSGTTSAGHVNDWLSANKPIRVTYDGMFWIADLPKPNATDLMGIVEIQNGGTGATTADEACAALGITEQLETINYNIAALEETINDKRSTYTATISTTWTGSAAPYTQSVSVRGLLATDTPHVTPVFSDTLATAIAQKEAWGMVSEADAGTNTITFTCFEDKPTTAIPIQIEVIR